MRLKFFTVPCADSQDAEREVNGFLAGHRVLSVDRELIILPPRRLAGA